jgi:hypothetical protein
MSGQPRAKLLLHRKFRYDDGAIREMILWQLPQADEERPHGLKYRLFYGKNNERLVCYDNESGKGDHKHVAGQEYPYHFVSVGQLLRDFMADIEGVR